MSERTNRIHHKQQSNEPNFEGEQHDDLEQELAPLKDDNDTSSTSSTTSSVDEEENKGKGSSSNANSKKVNNTPAYKKRLDMAVCAAYLLNSICYTLPIVMLPMIADEQAEQQGTSPSAFVATVASVSELGGAFGQFVNGIICSQIGGRTCSFLYLLGSALCCLLLSTSTSRVGTILAGFEFFESVQWTACSVILSNHYQREGASLAASITLLSLSNTAGTLLAKTLGAALLQRYSWRVVAQVAAAAAVLGSLLMWTLVSERPSTTTTSSTASAEANKGDKISAKKAIEGVTTVLKSRLFWLTGVFNSTAFLAFSSDKVLGNFFQEATELPSGICGGLTASVTVGFIHGLVSSGNFHSLSDAAKMRMLSRRYSVAVVATLVLAICANEDFGEFLHPSTMACIIALASGCMSSAMSFQFYQIPNMVSNKFGQNSAICLSFQDGMGYFFIAPIWAAISGIVGSGDHGWSIAWLTLAILYAMGGVCVCKVIQPILDSPTDEPGEVEHHSNEA